MSDNKSNSGSASSVFFILMMIAFVWITGRSFNELRDRVDALEKQVKILRAAK